MRMFVYLFPVVGLCVRVCVTVRPLETVPVTPFIVEGGTGVIHVFTMQRVEVACLSPIACYYGGMVNKVVLSLMYWSNAPVTPDPIRRGSSSDSLTQGMADDVLVAVR